MFGVEIINENPDEVIDLTGGSDAATQEEQTQETQPEGTEGSDGSDSTEQTQEQQQEEESAKSESESEEGGESASGDVEHFFAGERVSVAVPDEVSAALKEADIDEKALINQLFAKDSDFSLDDETRTKLEDKFGKTLVAGYLNMYKTMNEQSLKNASSAQEEQDKTFKQNQGEFLDAVGGADGLDAMESFIIENFNDKQIAAYNAVMESDSHEQQMLIVQTVRAQMELSDKLANGDKNIQLLGDATPSSPESSPLNKGYLTADEYSQYMDSDAYWSNSALQSRVDAARTEGLKRNL